VKVGTAHAQGRRKFDETTLVFVCTHEPGGRAAPQISAV
jgi:hypothetical protein